MATFGVHQGAGLDGPGRALRQDRSRDRLTHARPPSEGVSVRVARAHVAARPQECGELHTAAPRFACVSRNSVCLVSSFELDGHVVDPQIEELPEPCDSWHSLAIGCPAGALAQVLAAAMAQRSQKI